MGGFASRQALLETIDCSPNVDSVKGSNDGALKLEIETEIMGTKK